MTAITYTVTVAGSSVTSSTIQNASIMYGRQRVLDNFAPSTLYLQFLNPVTPWNVGQSVTVTAGGTTRFTGRIASLSEDQNVTTMTAVSEGLGYLAQQWCPTFTPYAPYITMTISAALQYSNVITDAEGNFLNNFGVVPLPTGNNIYCDYNYNSTTLGPGIDGTAQFGGTNLLDTISAIVANSSLPLLYEDPSGAIYFDAPSARSGTSTAFTLASNYIVRGSAAQQNVNSLLNRASVTWTGGTRRVTDFDSVASYGRRDYAATTQLTDVDDAALKASRIVGSYSAPYWQTNPVTVLVNNMTLARTNALLASKAGTLIDTSSIKTYFPGMEDQSYIEGWVERFTAKTSTFDLYLSPWSMTRKPESWQEVTGTLQWNSAGIVGLDWLDLITQDI